MKSIVEKNGIRILAGGLVFLLAATVSCVRPSAPARITIVGTNDIHGVLWPVAAFWRETPDPPPVGGFAALSYYVNRVREERENVIVLDAGDFFQGTPEGNLSLGMIPLAAMNRIGYDALALGNHEFDFGVEPVVELAAAADFPFLAANLKVVDPALPDFFRDYAIIEAEGVRILVIGVITPNLFYVTEPDLTGLLSVGEVERAVSRVMEETAGEWEVCVVLSHIGFEGDRELAAAVEGIDFIVGGHSHTGLTEPVAVGSTLITQTFGRNTTVSVLTFGFCRREGSVTTVDYELIELDYAEGTRDPEMEAFLEEATAEIRARMDVEIARAAEGLNRGRDLKSSPLGSFVADAIREAAGADLAFQNRAGVRADLPAGAVTRRRVFEISPFENTAVAAELTGAELAELIGHLFRREGYAHDFSDGVLITVDPDSTGADRIVEISWEGRPLRPDRRYRVATNSFLAASLSRRLPPDRAVEFKDTGIPVRRALERSIGARPEFSYEFKPRVRGLNEEPGGESIMEPIEIAPERGVY